MPILTVDVWEHTYYIDYRNRRPDYLKAFVDNLVNWDYVAERYEAAIYLEHVDSPCERSCSRRRRRSESISGVFAGCRNKIPAAPLPRKFSSLLARQNSQCSTERAGGPYIFKITGGDKD